jgi:serine/threonine protein kinase
MHAPTTAPDLVARARSSGLIEPERLDGYLARLEQRAGALAADALAGLLVRDGLLTRFQADALLRGTSAKLVLGKYRILDRLGSGSTGTVYLAQHVRMNRRVALKVLPPERAAAPGFVVRFRREAQAAAALDHPNIVRAYDLELDNESPFLVMEYVDGPSLRDLVKHSGPLDVPRACHYVRQAALGLQHAHEAGLVHRDIKPANILVSSAGVVKVLDMGLARFEREVAPLTQKLSPGVVLGTIDYLAPEQAIDSHVDIRADVYGLGATFYFLLTGEPPFAGGTVEQTLVWHTTPHAPRPVNALRPDVPVAVAAIVAKMLAKDAGDRYQAPVEVAQALLPWTQGPVAPLDVRAVPSACDSTNGTPSSFSATVLSATTGPGLSSPPPVAAPSRVATDWSGIVAAAQEPQRKPDRRSPPAGHLTPYVVALVVAIGLLGLVGAVFRKSASAPSPTPPAAPEVARLRPPTNLRATARPAGGIDLRWEAPAGQETAFTIERANNEELARAWAKLATTARGVTHYTDPTAAPGQPYYYRVLATSDGGTSDSSDTAWLPPSYANGFTPHGLIRNGSGGVAGTALRLTEAGGKVGQTRSAFYHLPLRIHAFTTRFRLHIAPGAKAAEGLTFCLQAVGPAALGGGGGGLGYEGMARSLAIKFDLANNRGEGRNSTGLYTDGEGPYQVGSFDLTPSGIDLHTGRAYDVKLIYARGNLSLTISDAAEPAKAFRKTFRVAITSIVQAPKAYAGFTASTSGVGAVQDVLSWVWEE